MTSISEPTDTERALDRLATDLEPTERHRLLADDLRRAFVEMLAASRMRTRHLSLGELASDLDRFEAANRAIEHDRQRLLTRLHHVHLPLLDQAGVLEYDPASKEVDLSP
jgi:hypothetical protein